MARCGLARRASWLLAAFLELAAAHDADIVKMRTQESSAVQHLLRLVEDAKHRGQPVDTVVLECVRSCPAPIDSSPPLYGVQWRSFVGSC